MLIYLVALRIPREVSTNPRVTAYFISFVNENARKILPGKLKIKH